MKEEFRPEIIEAIRKRATLGFPTLPSDWCLCRTCNYAISITKIVSVIEKYGRVCVDCRRKAGVAW